MKRALLAAGFLLAGSLTAIADTIILTDGTRYDGTFYSGNSRTVTMTDSNTGRRRTFDVRNVREVIFGNYASVLDSSTSGNTATTDSYALVQRLHDNVSRILASSTNLTASQRDLLRNSQSALRAALDRRDPDDNVLMRDIRRAMDDIRYVANSGVLRVDDRNSLVDNIEQIRQARSNERRNDDVFGTRSRTR